MSTKQKVADTYNIPLEGVKDYKIRYEDDTLVKMWAAFFYNDKGSKRYFRVVDNEIEEIVPLNKLTDKERDWTIFHNLVMWGSTTLPTLLTGYVEKPIEAKQSIIEYLEKTIKDLNESNR